MERAPDHRPDEDTPEAKAVSADICVHALALDFLASDEGHNHSMSEVVNFDEAQAMGTDNKDPAGLGGSSICIARVYPLNNGESSWFVGKVIETRTPCLELKQRTHAHAHAHEHAHAHALQHAQAGEHNCQDSEEPFLGEVC